LWQVVRLDRLTGKLATEHTPPDVVEERVYKVYPDEHRVWAEAHGIPQPPTEPSDVFTFAPRAEIHRPLEGARVSGLVTITGTADVPLLDRYELRVRATERGSVYGAVIAATRGRAVRDGVLGVWNTAGLDNGAYDLRLRVHDRLGRTHDRVIRAYVRNALPSATPTATPTASASATLAPSPTPTGQPAVPTSSTAERTAPPAASSAPGSPTTPAPSAATAVPPPTSEPPTASASPGTSVPAPSVVPPAPGTASAVPPATRSTATVSALLGTATTAPAVATVP
jgi:hypothetical protein